MTAVGPLGPDRSRRQARVEERGFTLDPFQVEAIAAVDDGASVLVAAPTGSGKTVVADHGVDRALAQGLKAFYTTPIKALSNQKFADLRSRHGAEKVGLITGDTTVNNGAPVLVMTTEVLRNMLYARSPALDGLGLVVLDEVHYLQDRYRGPVWEEVIIHLPASVRIVALSATVSNAEELAGWIDAIRGRTVTVVEHRRPVELSSLYAAQDRATRDLVVLPVVVDGEPNPMGEKLDVEPLDRRGDRRSRRRRRYATPRRPEVVEHLEEEDLLPAICFVFSRRGCDEAARGLLEAGVRLTDPGERRRIRAIAEAHTASLSESDLEVLDHDLWLAGLEQGIAAHHAGMVPPFKEAVEACFVQGLVKVVFATETLALGINMPARSVVIETLSKFTGEAHEPLTPGQYTQLTGRAGRRGIDEVGRAFVLWSPFSRFQQVADLVMSRRFDLRSAFRPTYNMAANLVRRHSREEAHRLLDRSFAQYQSDQGVVALRTRRDAREATLARLEAEATCDRGDVEEYRRLLRRDDQARVPGASRYDVLTALARLRPGDVVWLGGSRLAVLSVGWRGSDRGRLHTVDDKGRSRTISSDDIDEVVSRAGEVDLPIPYAPHDRAFQHQVGENLARLRGGRKSKGQGGRSGPASEARRHSVADCPDARAHVRSAVQADRVGRELADIDRRIRGSEGSVSRELDAVLDVLDRRGMVEGWSLTAKGALLVRIFHECDLLIADCLAAGLLDGLDPPALAGVVSCFTYEHRSKVPAPPPWFPDRPTRQRVEAVLARADRLRGDEEDAGLPATRLPDPTFLRLAHAWAAGRDLDELLGDEEMSGGDFVRNVRALVDLLRQIGEAAIDPATGRAARSAADALARGVVAASSLATTGGDSPTPAVRAEVR